MKHNEMWKSDLIESRGWMCEYCRIRRAVHLHHALIGDMKRYKKILLVEENLMAACPFCHTGKELLDTEEVRLWFWDVQVERYGHAHMLAWIKGLPLKVKSNLYR